MAWQCSSTSNDGLADNLFQAGILRTPRVVDAFKATDRASYVVNKADAYRDSPSYLSHSATISAPHMHAHALENLESHLVPGAKVMDVGAGSGYLLGIFLALVQPGGVVLGVEHIPHLTEFMRSNLSRLPDSHTARALSSSPPSIRLVTCDGRQGSPPSETPEGGWDVIHVGAAAPTLPPKLVEQLARGGRMFIPVGTEDQAIWQIDKDLNGTVRKRRLFGVRYVPLTDVKSQIG